MINVAFFDAKSYDRRSFSGGVGMEAIRFHFHESRLNAETARLAEGAKAVCIFVNDVADAASLKVLKALGVEMIALRCAGFNNVDLHAARELGLKVVRVPAYSPHSVAEHAVGLLLTLNRKIHRAFNRVREHNFSLSGLVGFDVAGKTVGIIGTGKIGKLTAQIFRGFEANVLAYDPFADTAWAEGRGITYVPLPELFAKSDIISLHTPLTADTKHLLRAETFQQMKRGVFIINTSRGKLIHTKALIDALKSGHIGGVALDVYEEEEGIFFEDRSDDVALDDVLARLLTFPNVLITSHQAFLTEEALREISRVTTGNLLRFDKGEEFLNGTSVH